jgi:phosphatidylserine decarboxylase
MLTTYGVDVVRKYLFLIALLFIVTFFLTESIVLRIVIVSLLGIAVLFILNFFRDPERTSPEGENLIVSPADGKVILIKELFEQEYLKCDALQISIFMSPLDVHVNRFPISGKVGYFRYIQGDYIAAFNDKSSERNERTHIGVEKNGFKVLFKQIAGAVAQRIIANVSVGQEAKRGERFGMIRFGSRVDVIMQKEVDIKVKLNDRVRAGETVLATIVAPIQNV